MEQAKNYWIKRKWYGKKFCSLILLLYLSISPVMAENNLIEITCDTIQTITLIPANKYVESYITLGFFIDDYDEKLYFAPSKKECISASKHFSKNSISLYGVPYIKDMVGNIEINRNSGTINMKFQNRGGRMTTVYTGRCKRIENSSKF